MRAPRAGTRRPGATRDLRWAQAREVAAATTSRTLPHWPASRMAHTLACFLAVPHPHDTPRWPERLIQPSTSAGAIRRVLLAQRSTPIDVAPPPPAHRHSICTSRSVPRTVRAQRAPGGERLAKEPRERCAGIPQGCTHAVRRCTLRARAMSLARTMNEVRMRNTPCAPTDLHEQWRPSARRRRAC